LGVDAAATVYGAPLAASASLDKSVRILDLARLVVRRTLTMPTPAFSVAFAQLSPQLAAGCFSTVSLWDVKTGHAVATLGSSEHVGALYATAWHPSSTLLATGGDDAKVRLWDARAGSSTVALTGHATWVQSVAFSADGASLISGSTDGVVKVWDVRSPSQPVLAASCVPNSIVSSAIRKNAGRAPHSGEVPPAPPRPTATTSSAVVARKPGSIVSIISGVPLCATPTSHRALALDRLAGTSSTARLSLPLALPEFLAATQDGLVAQLAAASTASSTASPSSSTAPVRYALRRSVRGPHVGKVGGAAVLDLQRPGFGLQRATVTAGSEATCRCTWM
jgi:hypothetical protein